MPQEYTVLTDTPRVDLGDALSRYAEEGWKPAFVLQADPHHGARVVMERYRSALRPRSDTEPLDPSSSPFPVPEPGDMI